MIAAVKPGLVLAFVLVALMSAALHPPFLAAQTPSSDATLSSLTVNDGTSDVVLDPVFTSATTSYRVAIKHRGETITVAAVPTDTNVTFDFLDRSDAALTDADPDTTGFQVNAPVGESEFKVKVTAQDGVTTELYEVAVQRNSARFAGWTPTQDVNPLHTDNSSPKGIWSDGTTFWVADDEDDKLYAYSLSDGTRQDGTGGTSDKELSFHADNDSAKGIWSDGTTVWVADDEDDKLYAYSLSDGTRQDGTGSTTDKELGLHADNADPWGIWSDGTTLWVADQIDFRLYAYALSGGARSQTREFALSPSQPAGVWSDGNTIWVAVGVSPFERANAYTLDFSNGTAGPNHGQIDPDKSLFELEPAVTRGPAGGIWSDGKEAMWVSTVSPASPKLHSYNISPSEAGGVALSALTVNHEGSAVALRPSFHLSTVRYWVSVPNEVNQVTVSATVSTGSTIAYVGGDGPLEDADANTDGHQVGVDVGTTAVGVLVTAADGDALIHNVFVERDSARFRGWTPTRDIHNLRAAGNTHARGISSDGTTIWVADDQDGKLYAYTLATDVRDQSKDITLHADNDDPAGMWSDGTTIWVAESFSSGTPELKIYAYTLVTGVRDLDKDITLHADNTHPTGIWSNGTIIWVADRIDRKIYAYNLSDSKRQDGTDSTSNREFELTEFGGGVPEGIWSDGTTMWAINSLQSSLYAYTLASGARATANDISPTISNRSPAGLWSNGSTIWVSEPNRSPRASAYYRVFSYTLPPSAQSKTTLSGLTVDPSPPVPSFSANLRPEFTFDIDSYRVAVPNEASTVTVTATPKESDAEVAYLSGDGETLTDSDTGTDGLQVAVAVGATLIEIRVAKGTFPPLLYTVIVERDSVELYGWTPTGDFNTLLKDNPALRNDAVRGEWGTETTLYVTPQYAAKIFAYNRSDGSRDESKDITIDQSITSFLNGHKAGIWSDGSTLWSLDYFWGQSGGTESRDSTGKLFAYNISAGETYGERDTTKEFGLHLDTVQSARGIWSNRTTVWVSDWRAGKLFAYTLATGAKDASKDITLTQDNAAAQGIWSDGTTIWVADWEDDKFYAYKMMAGDEFGARDESKEFDLAPDNLYPRDVWSDGETMYVPDAHGPAGQKLYSYNMISQSSAPEFTSDATFSVEENKTGVGTVEATDNDGDAVAYELTAGADLAQFQIDAASGLLTFAAAPDHENPADADSNNVYLVTVTATGGTGDLALTTDQAITVTVTDVDEPPSAPATPTVSAVSDSSDSLSVSWTAPGNSGKPAIESYDLQYRKGTTGNFADGPQDVTVTTATIDGLDADSLYQVRVRASNDEGDSAWSSAGSGTTNALAEELAETTVPADWSLIPSGLGAGDRFRLVFLSSTTRNGSSSDIADYNTFVQNAAANGHTDIQSHSSTFRVVGSTADVDTRDNTATTYTADDKGVEIYWLGGNKVADEYEDFYDGDWDDEANAKDESGSDRSISLDTERPLTGSDHNGTEAFSGLSSRALGASFVRTGSPNSSTSGYGPLGSNFVTGNSDTRPLYGLSPVFRVEGQVVINTPPAFASADVFSVNENETIVGTVEATDDDAGDAVRYAITGGADSAQFQIDETTGVLRFTTAPDYEMPADVESTDPADDAGNNVYLVTVTATSGAGDRELTVMQTISVTVNDVVAGLGAPTELNAAADGRTAIDLSWTAPVVEGAAITGYRIEVSTDDDPTWTDAVTNTNSTDTRYRYTDVLPGATYHFRVSAIDSGGPGTASDVASVSIDPGPRSFLFHSEEARLPTIDRTGRQFEMWFIFQNLGKPVFLSENILDAIQVEHGMASDVRCLVEAFVSCASSPNSGHNYYVFTVTADESQYSGSEGTLTVSLRTNVIEGGNQAAQREFSVDLRDLTVTLAGPPQQPVTGDFYVDIEFNLSVTTQSGNLEGDPLWHFRTDDVTVDRGEVRSISSSSGSDVDMNWSTEIRPPDSYEGDLTVQILANAVRAEEHTNGNEPSEVLTVRVDTLPPTVTITARETVVRKSTFKVTFTFSEPVTGFTEDDIGVAGGTLVAGSLTRPEADDPVWTVRVTAAETPDNDQVGISLPPDTVTDEPGNLNSALAALFVTVVYEPSLVPTTWSLIPSGLGDGDSFRLLFIGTTSRNASSSDIADYNTFVQDLAAAGHADIRAHSAPFRMLGSTENVDARDNTGTTGTGVPIYWLGGAKVADDYADFYDGDWDEEATGRRETGDSVSIGTSWKIWTGSAHDGTEAMDATTGTSRALGNSGNHWVMQGSPNGSVSAHGPIESDTAGRTTTRGVYGLSGVFTVDASLETPNAAPEFTSAASFSVEENQTAVDMVEATDEDAGDTVSYAITGGADQAKFDIDASSGVLTFKDAPDHENPTDAGGNNTYMVTVTATGGTGDRAMTEEQTITVTVTDVDETPAVLTVVVTSSPGTGTDTYGQGQPITVTVTFDQAVRVTGTPRIQLRVGGSDPATQLKWANYDGGSGRAALRFTYRVQAADMDSDGIFIEADELELNSGTIQGVDDDLAANLDYPRQGTQSGHKVDGSLVGTKPSAPAPPWVQALAGSTSALDVRWIEPADSVVDSYDLRYRKDGSGDWEDGPQDVADTRSEITGLESGSPYEVQVRATNSRGNSGWSPSTTGYPATVYDIDGIYIYWTERQGSEKLHDDAADLGSSMLENACDTGESFRAIWLQPLESSDADEWEADVQTIEGTGTAQYTLRTAPELTGAVALDGFTIIGIRIRGRFGEDWSNWSRAVNLICVPTEDDSGSATGNSSTGSENATSNPLTGFEVVDATAHLDAGAVEDGATLTGIDPAKVYGFRVNVASGAELKSVKLELSGPGPDDRVARTENYKPYSLYGDSDGHEHGAALPTGSYTLTATAHSETNGGGSQLGTLSVDFTVVGAPLTVSFEGLPQTGHGGAGAPFTFRLAFSEAVTTTPEALRDHVLEVTNATIEAVSRVDERSDLWEVRLTPESDAMVTVFLSPAADCDAAGAVCTPDGRMLSHGVGRAIVAQPPNSAATGAPAITGTAQVGQTLTADTSAIADEDGLTNVVYSYQWMADGANIQGATGSSYTLTEVDKGKTIKVTVTFTDAEGNPETLTSDPTGEVAAKPNSPATGAPTITGTAQVGETLASDVTTIADEDGLTKVSYSYQWMVDDANIQGEPAPATP